MLWHLREVSHQCSVTPFNIWFFLVSPFVTKLADIFQPYISTLGLRLCINSMLYIEGPLKETKILKSLWNCYFYLSITVFHLMGLIYIFFIIKLFDFLTKWVYSNIALSGFSKHFSKVASGEGLSRMIRTI